MVLKPQYASVTWAFTKRIAGPDSVDPVWDPRICISDKFLGSDADDFGVSTLRTTDTEKRVQLNITFNSLGNGMKAEIPRSLSSTCSHL